VKVIVGSAEEADIRLPGGSDSAQAASDVRTTSISGQALAMAEIRASCVSHNNRDR
jgi:hypothetical protein